MNCGIKYLHNSTKALAKPCGCIVLSAPKATGAGESGGMLTIFTDSLSICFRVCGEILKRQMVFASPLIRTSHCEQTFVDTAGAAGGESVCVHRSRGQTLFFPFVRLNRSAAAPIFRWRVHNRALSVYFLAG